MLFRSIQSQDDPSVDEVMGWLSANGLNLYSSYPPFLLPLLGDSVHHRPKFNAAQTRGMASIAETVWLLQKDGDRENLQALDGNHREYSERLSSLTSYVENLNSESSLDMTRFNDLADAAVAAFNDLSLLQSVQTRLTEFVAEAKQFIKIVETSSLDGIRQYLDTCKHLFKGAVGVRHVDFIAYKEN